MNREQFFQELRTALHREGFTPQPEQDELLPVEWDGLPWSGMVSHSAGSRRTEAFATGRRM